MSQNTKSLKPQTIVFGTKHLELGSNGTLQIFNMELCFINVYQVLRATNNHYMIHTELSSNSTLKCLGLSSVNGN